MYYKLRFRLSFRLKLVKVQCDVRLSLLLSVKVRARFNVQVHLKFGLRLA